MTREAEKVTKDMRRFIIACLVSYGYCAALSASSATVEVVAAETVFDSMLILEDLDSSVCLDWRKEQRNGTT